MNPTESQQQPLFGHTRTNVAHRHALLTPDGFVPSTLPGWGPTEINLLISPAIGARLNQWLAHLNPEHTATGSTTNHSTLFYLLEGQLTINQHQHHTGGYTYLPPNTPYEIQASQPSRLLVFEKTWQPLDHQPNLTPHPIHANQNDIPSEPFLGNEDALLQTLLPTDLPYDMAVNIFTYQPGATLPFVETHIMEHGLMMLAGQGIYRLDQNYYPVTAGDVIWMAPYCPQWYVSMGKTPSAYIYYKDINRHPHLP